MSTSFLSNPAWRRVLLSAPILAKKREHSACLPCLASTDYFNQINCLAFFFTASENLSRRQRMRTLRIDRRVGKH
ncbi:hypothetical protein AAGT95_04485 [Salinicola lusitanus]|uniref:Uncharacterized protein n=1 Tax=Salinicola lusitanus TaxID=1949085 RepID=A0ABZ3CVZ8_9GAMM